VLAGGGALAWAWSDRSWSGPASVGLISLLVFVSVLVLLFRGAYPRSIFDFVLGLNRWVLRALAYAAVMTPEYPPFRIDVGESEQPTTLAATAQALAPSAERAATVAESAARRTERWGPGRIIALLTAGILGLIAFGLFAAGGAAVVLDQTQRDSSGYLMTSTEPYATSTYALVSGGYRGGTAGDWFVSRDLIGTVKIRVTGARPIFIGIGPESAVNTYLAGVAQALGHSLTTGSDNFHTYPGGAPATPPTAQQFWGASATGPGTQTVTWKPRPGNWRIVLMNANGSAHVSSDLSIGARLPYLLAIGIAAVSLGLVLLLISGGAIYLAVRPARSLIP
jgi:hypothetical protein